MKINTDCIGIGKYIKVLLDDKMLEAIVGFSMIEFEKRKTDHLRHEYELIVSDDGEVELKHFKPKWS